ncbi:CoA transferase [Paraburkholderia piptadeniae]
MHGGIISDRMQLWCESRTSADALSELATARIPAGPVLRPGELVRHPHAEATGLFDWVD